MGTHFRQNPEIECEKLYKKVLSLTGDITCRRLSPPSYADARNLFSGSCHGVDTEGVHDVAFAYRPAVPIVSASKQESRYADAEAGWATVHTSRLSLSLVKKMLIGATAENSTYSYV